MTESRFSPFGSCAANLEQSFDLDRRPERQRGGAHGGAGVAALVAEHFDHQVGGAVHHLWAVAETRRRIDETAEADHPRHLVELSERALELRQQIDYTGARRFLPVLDGNAV